ncbi:MAG: disulfide bond formation protein B [Rhizobiaceae bacterium]|nr:disulfide bond formation protein B [Rhizobiaceae bacterium]
MSDNASPIKALTTPILEDHKKVTFYGAILMALVVGSALAFEHIGGFIPCALCLEQRMPYYVGIPLMLMAGFTAIFVKPAIFTRGLILIAGLLMVYGVYLGSFHSGVEWGWWPGPESCTTVADGLSMDASNLLGDLNAKRPPSCDEAAGQFLGLSFAGWNVIASAILAFFTIRLAFRRV